MQKGEAMKYENPPFLIPMELNDKTVQIIFHGNSSLDIIADDTTKRLIRYLYGQLKTVHEGKTEFTLREAFYNYCGDLWTNEITNLMFLLSLGYMSGICSEASDPEEKNTLSDVHIKLLDEEVLPTFSPKDAAFLPWSKEYLTKNKL